MALFYYHIIVVYGMAWCLHSAKPLSKSTKTDFFASLGHNELTAVTISDSGRICNAIDYAYWCKSDALASVIIPSLNPYHAWLYVVKRWAALVLYGNTQQCQKFGKIFACYFF